MKMRHERRMERNCRVVITVANSSAPVTMSATCQHHVSKSATCQQHVSKLSANCQQIASTVSAKKRRVCQTHSRAPNAHLNRAFRGRGKNREELPRGHHRREEQRACHHVMVSMSATCQQYVRKFSANHQHDVSQKTWSVPDTQSCPQRTLNPRVSRTR